MKVSRTGVMSCAVYRAATPRTKVRACSERPLGFANWDAGVLERSTLYAAMAT